MPFDSLASDDSVRLILRKVVDIRTNRLFGIERKRVVDVDITCCCGKESQRVDVQLKSRGSCLARI